MLAIGMKKKTEKDRERRAEGLSERLFSERREDGRALHKILQYKGKLRNRTDVRRSRWKCRWGQLDAESRQFYMRGLLNYQGWSWTEIFEREKGLGAAISENTLQRRLELLLAQDMVKREPPGKRGKFYFRQPSEMLDGADSIPFPDVVRSWRHYIDSASTPEEKPARLADVLWKLTLGYGLLLHELLGRLAASRRSLRERQLFSTMNNEAYEIDMMIDFMAMRLVLKEYPDIAEDALAIFNERLTKALKGSE